MTKARSNATAPAAKGQIVVGTGTDASGILSVGNAGETLVADSSASTGLRWQGNYAAGKNAIINGDFLINQRNFTSNTSNGAFNFDRFFQSNSGGTYTVTPQTFTPGTAPVAGYEGKTYLQSVTASQTGTSDFAGINQQIESVRTFAGQSVVVSFWAKANTGTPKVGVSMRQQFGSGGSPSADVRTAGNSTVTLSTSWARYSITVSIPSISGKTLGTTHDGAVTLQIWQSLGSDYTTGFPSGIGLQNFTLSLWGVQVETGSVATAFQTATGTLAGELAACQRYYYRNTGVTYYAHCLGNIFSSTVASFFIQPPVQMRVGPTAVEFSTLAVGEQGTLIAVTNITIGHAAPNGIQFDAIGTGFTANRWAYLQNNNSTAGYLAFTAEL